MTNDDTKLKEILERVKNLPEDANLPEDILSELSQAQLIAIYIERMIADKGVEPTDELREKLYTKLNNQITKNLLLAMPDYLVEQLNKNFDEGAADDVIEKAINESGIDVEKITEETMTAFREQYLSGEEK